MRLGAPRIAAVLWCSAGLSCSYVATAQEDDGAYGRLEGDLSLSIEAGASADVGEASAEGPSASLALRAGILYLHTAGLVAQYDEGFDNDAQLLRRTVMGAVQLRPFFIGRMAQDMQHGPPLVDLLVDSISLDLGLYRTWNNDRFCADTNPARGEPASTPCRDFGMAFGLGAELSLLPRANAPFIALHAAMRWSMDERSAAYESGHPSGLFTLALGYHHLIATHLVDAGDRLPP